MFLITINSYFDCSKCGWKIRGINFRIVLMLKCQWFKSMFLYRNLRWPSLYFIEFQMDIWYRSIAHLGGHFRGFWKQNWHDEICIWIWGWRNMVPDVEVASSRYLIGTQNLERNCFLASLIYQVRLGKLVIWICFNDKNCVCVI